MLQIDTISKSRIRNNIFQMMSYNPTEQIIQGSAQRQDSWYSADNIFFYEKREVYYEGSTIHLNDFTKTEDSNSEEKNNSESNSTGFKKDEKEQFLSEIRQAIIMDQKIDPNVSDGNIIGM